MLDPPPPAAGPTPRRQPLTLCINRLRSASTAYVVGCTKTLFQLMPNSLPPRLPSGRRVNPSDPAHVSITVRLPVALYEQLTAAAKQEERSRNFMAVKLLSLVLEGNAVINQIIEPD
jgi:hypothetical protein